MTEPGPTLQEALAEGIAEIFGLTLLWAPAPGARRISLGGDVPPAFIETRDFAQLAQIQRYLRREVERLRTLERTRQQLDQLRQKTTTLLPQAPEGSGLSEWSAAQMDLGLLGHLDGRALAVDGAVVRRENIDEADVRTTLAVLERHPSRLIPVQRGQLLGIRHGRIAVVVLSRSPLEKIDHDLVALLATWTDRLLAEQGHLRRLEELRALAEQATNAKSAFLAQMSHELRTPLGGMLGLAQLLSDSTLSEDQTFLLQTLLESGRWLNKVVDAILDFSKLEAGQVTLERLPFSVPELLASCCSGVQTLAAERGLALEHWTDPTIPPQVEGDPTRIRQALLNLVSNALKFTTHGGIRVRVRVLDGALLRFEVQDDGIGIPPERMGAIFEPFTQADSSTSRRYGGTGLGLTLVREFARLHDGDAGVESTVGVGSTFWFTARLPAATADAEAVAPPESTAPPAQRHLHILVAEDHPVNQLVIRRMLEGMGHQVELVDTGTRAIARLQQACDVDLVLMDHMMPELDGPAATQRLRALGGPFARLPIVALTAAVTQSDLALYEESGFDDVLAKPIDRARLARLLADLPARAQPAPPPSSATSAAERHRHSPSG